MEHVIRRMYAEIDDYSGDFGDGIDTGPYNPFEKLDAGNLSDFESLGMSISALCYLASAIDNSTYEHAVASETGKCARSILKENLVDLRKKVRNALEAFFVSEPAFLDALKQVYSQVVKPELANGENAT